MASTLTLRDIVCWTARAILDCPEQYLNCQNTLLFTEVPNISEGHVLDILNKQLVNQRVPFPETLH